MISVVFMKWYAHPLTRVAHGEPCLQFPGSCELAPTFSGNINQSLLTLGRVITALVDRAPHVPYRYLFCPEQTLFYS